MYCSFPNLTSAALCQSLLNSYSKKIKYFILFDEIGKLTAGLQLPLNLPAIYHQNEIMETNLQRIMNNEFKSYI
jgi:hypothetical protein